LSIRAGRFFPSTLALAITLGAILEYTLFRHGYMLADRSTVAIAYKGARLEEGRSEDVIVIGPSTALAIDARALEASVNNAVTIYNYALPNLGTTEQYLLILKKYLRYNRHPRRVVLALPPDFLLNETGAQPDPLIRDIERQRFRRFFGPLFLLTDVAPATGRWSFAAEAAATLLPSMNYRTFIKNATFAVGDDPWEAEPIGSARSLYQRNRRIVERLEATNGQLIYNGNSTVPASWIAKSMPADPDPRSPQAVLVERAIGFASEAGISTTLLFTPMCCERAAKLEADGTWALLLPLVHDYERRYATFQFIDIGHSPYDQQSFGDATHVNELGARRFNAELMARARVILFAPDDAVQ